jgi:hypothetical protein
VRRRWLIVDIHLPAGEVNMDLHNERVGRARGASEVALGQRSFANVETFVFVIDALQAFGVELEIESIYEDTVKCHLWLEVGYPSDFDGSELGAILLPGICLSRTALLQLARQIADWIAARCSGPRCFKGSFDLKLLQEARVELTFGPYRDVEEKTRGELSLRLSNARAIRSFPVDESALAALATQLLRRLDT